MDWARTIEDEILDFIRKRLTKSRHGRERIDKTIEAVMLGTTYDREL